MSSNTCCEKQNLKDLSQGIGDIRNLFCQSCKSHYYDGNFYSKEAWELWVNSLNE